MARYRANTPQLVDETVDGEALIMDMVTGTYYSCAGASAVAWNGLKDGAEADDVAATISSAYGIPEPEARRDVRGFLAGLVEEGVLVERGDDPPALAHGAIDAGPGAGGPYEGLSLEKHTDLADLLLLDPVHDVTEAGWPHQPT
jgi:hypothetical protein